MFQGKSMIFIKYLSSIMLTLGTLIIKQLILQGLLVTTEAPGSFLESENLTKLECTGLLGR